MLKKCLLSLALTALLLSACSVALGGPKETTLNKAFSLKVGQRADLAEAGLSITFDEVVSDNRCPQLVECVQQGPVIIRLTVKSQGGQSESFSMNPDGEAAPGWLPNQVVYAGYRVRLLSVEPYPQSPEDLGDFDKYQALLAVEQ